MLDVSRIMRIVTQSLFPQFQITCHPLQPLATSRFSSYFDRFELF